MRQGIFTAREVKQAISETSIWIALHKYGSQGEAIEEFILRLYDALDLSNLT